MIMHSAKNMEVKSIVHSRNIPYKYLSGNEAEYVNELTVRRGY